MGNGSYFQNNLQATKATAQVRAVNHEAFNFSATAKKVHTNLNPCDKIRECLQSTDHPVVTPIVIAMDVTASRGDDAKTIFSRVPALLGMLQVDTKVPDPAICWVGIGDTNSDRAPLQVSQFEADTRIDEQLQQIWLEGGGGGTGQESYELAAYYLLKNTKLDANLDGKKGYLFILGDETPYSMVSAKDIQKYVDSNYSGPDIPTAEVFEALKAKYEIYFIWPGAPLESRKAGIDKEIRDRLDKAGGMYKDVDIRASLIWNTRDDLDLHCMTPSGKHIFYGSKRQDNGELDVDRNVQGETNKPVENIRWPTKQAQEGKYTFWVENYRNHESKKGDIIPFSVEIDVNGTIQTIQGEASGSYVHKKIEVATISYQRPGIKVTDDPDYASYTDEHVLEEWSKYLDPKKIIRLTTPKHIPECITALLSISHGENMFDCLSTMKTREVPEETVQELKEALISISKKELLK